MGSKCSTWMQYKNNRMISFVSKEPFNISVIRVYAPTSNVEEVEVEWFDEEL